MRHVLGRQRTWPSFIRGRSRRPLPAIRVPLRESDADVTLNLQALIDQCYENGGYDTIDYHQPPVPPLDPACAAWAEKMAPCEGRVDVAIG